MPKENAEYASLRDLHDMWIAASTGQSAQLMRPSTCPVEFENDIIRVMLGFYTWPSSPDLPFSLSPAMGVISAGQKIEKVKEFSVFVNNQDSFALEYYMTEISTYWETPTFDRDGGDIPAPVVTIDGNYLRFSTEVFGAIRIKGIAIGFHHVVTMELEKGVDQEPSAETEPAETPFDEDDIITGLPEYWDWNSPKIENLENTITATWVDGEESETEQLRLELPLCVEELLKMCPNAYTSLTAICNEISTLTVEYNACTGAVIRVYFGKDPWRYCTIIPPGTTAIANPWGIGTL